MKMRLADMAGSAIAVRQNKTGKLLRIQWNDIETGQRAQLAQMVNKIRNRPRKIASMH